MLDGTKEQLQNLFIKIQGFDACLSSLNSIHKDYAPKVDELVKKISEEKLKRIEELNRLLS